MFSEYVLSFNPLHEYGSMLPEHKSKYLVLFVTDLKFKLNVSGFCYFVRSTFALRNCTVILKNTDNYKL